jgi:hypothetical protein
MHVFSAPLDCESVALVEESVELLKHSDAHTKLLATSLYRRLAYETDAEPLTVSVDDTVIDVANVISAGSAREWQLEDTTDSFTIHGAKVQILCIDEE